LCVHVTPLIDLGDFSLNLSPEFFIGDAIRVSPGFPLKACGNDGLKDYTASCSECSKKIKAILSRIEKFSGGFNGGTGTAIKISVPNQL